jgi:hypothetical protein
MGHALRSSSLLRLEVSQARVSQTNLKTGRATAQMVHMASSQRSCGDEAKNEWVDASTPTLSFSLFSAIRSV